jgi:nitrogen fixation protein FixH
MSQHETNPLASPPAEDEEKRARRAAIVWPGIIIGLLTAQVLLLLVMAYIATSDQSFAVEPDYYQKALNWDQLAAQDRLNKQLGWSAHIKVSDAADLMKRRDVTCKLSRDKGEPLSGATVELIAFPHARAGERLKSTLTEQEAGDYTTNIPIARPGLWEFRITAEYASNRFTRVIQQEIKSPGATSRWRR